MMTGTVTTVESYGAAGDGSGGVVQNNFNSGPQSSQVSDVPVELMTNMRLVYSSDAAAVYKQVMPTTPPHSSSARQAGGDGSVLLAAPLSIDASGGDQTKRKRGRPRKYHLDGNMTPLLTSASAPPQEQQPGFPAPPAVVPKPPSGKKSKGKPPGSGRKQRDAASGSPKVELMAHVINVNTGQDVSSKILSFSQKAAGPICILSANGAISNVTLRQETSGGTVTYEGRFMILYLSGSYTLLESGDQRSRVGGLTVLLAGLDGSVIGGGVAGLLIAAAPVQVVVGRFIADQESKSQNQANPLTAPAKLVPGASGAGAAALCGTMGESSGGPGSPHNQSVGACNNNNPQGVTTLPWN